MLNGRINRKTFIMGSLISLTVLGVIGFLFVVPIALIDLVVNNKTVDSILGKLYFIMVFPGLLYLYYLCVSMIKRAHDIGIPGLLLVIAFVLCILIAKLTSFNLLNWLVLIVLATLAFVPGSKKRNRFGPVPYRKFKISELKIHN